MNTLETQDFGMELKALDDSGTIEGMGSVANNLDGGRDIVDEKALSAVVDDVRRGKPMPKMLWQHDSRKIVGVWDEMSVKGEGLYMKGRLLLDLPLAKEAHILLKNKAIDGLSIGYRTLDYEMEGDNRARRLKKIDLLETSLVTFPMNPKARVSDVKHLLEVRDVEQILRDAGVPNKFAKLVAIHGFDEAKQLLERERDAPKLEPKQVSDLQTKLTKLKEALNA